MKNKHSLKLSTLLLIILLSSCRKELSNVEAPESYTTGSFSQIFDAFWNGMNNNYVFWDVDSTNWDNMYTKYKPVFAGLDVSKKEDIKKSVRYFREMTAGLIDSHYSLSFGSPISDSSVSPSYDRKSKAGALKTRYLFYAYDASIYLDKGYIYGNDPYNSMGSESTAAVAGTINRNILYLGFNQFNLKAAYESPDNAVKRALQFFIDRLRNPSGLKGIIIDLRGNRGGLVADLNFLVGNMIGSKLTIGHTRYKNGNGRLDYTPWVPAIVTPQPGATDVQVPVVSLTDTRSVSMAELTAMSIRLLKNGTVVGERTWGATGPLSLNEVYNGGQFSAAKFVNTYTSSSMFKYINGNVYEGKGFPPDHYVEFKTSEPGDKQLEKAISLIP